jgi:anti-sigma factor RsiW
MNCPLESRENAGQLLDYCARKLDPDVAAVLERHIAICPACRQFADNQRAVWQALDAWEAEPVSADFNRRLYQRIDQQVSWWDRFVQPLRPLTVRWNVAASMAGVFVVLAAGLLLNRPPAPVMTPFTDTAQVESVQPEQVERALDAMDTLTEFSHHVKDSADAKM